MKKKLFLTCAMLLLAISQLQAQGGISLTYDEKYRVIYKTIIQSVQACGPVTVEAAKIDNSGNVGKYYLYTVSSGTVWDKPLKIKGGYDCNGTNLRVEGQKKREEKHYPNGININGSIYHEVIYVTYYYTLYTGSGSHKHSSSSNQSSGGQSSSNSPSRSSGNSQSSGGNFSSDNRAAELGKAWADAATATKALDYAAGYRPGGFSLSANIGYAWGENVELRLRYGSTMFGGDISAMVGGDGIYGTGFLWNVGIGMYFGGRPSELYLWDVGLDVKLGRSVFQQTGMIDLNTTHLIGPKHIMGLTAGTGIGIAGPKANQFAWDVRFGFVVYFLQWNWL